MGGEIFKIRGLIKKIIMKYTIDAENKKLGRVASEVAALLIGKNRTDFAKNTVAEVCVEVINTSKIAVSSKKMAEKIYARYSGYPGGLRHPTMKNIVEKKGFAEIFLTAVYSMLPTNKLRAKLIKNLIVKE